MHGRLARRYMCHPGFIDHDAIRLAAVAGGPDEHIVTDTDAVIRRTGRLREAHHQCPTWDVVHRHDGLLQRGWRNTVKQYRQFGRGQSQDEEVDVDGIGVVALGRPALAIVYHIRDGATEAYTQRYGQAAHQRTYTGQADVAGFVARVGLWGVGHAMAPTCGSQQHQTLTTSGIRRTPGNPAAHVE